MTGNEVTGKLIVTRNDKSASMVLDDKISPDYIWVRCDDFPKDGIYRRFAASTKFLAYSINYDISMTNQMKEDGTKEKCLILNRADPRSQYLFYPFSRRFFHRSESRLDAALYQLMYQLAVFERYPNDATKAQQAITARFPSSKKYITALVDLIRSSHPVIKPASLIEEEHKSNHESQKNKTNGRPSSKSPEMPHKKFQKS